MRRKMQIGDWLNVAALIVVGTYFGVAIANLLQLVGTGFWPLMIIIPLLFGGVFLLDIWLDRIVVKLFTGGIKRTLIAEPKQKRPLALLLSMPIGICICIVGIRFGLDKFLL